MIVPSRAQLSADVARHYDELDRFYREIWGEHLHHGWWETGRESKEEAVEKLALLVAKEVLARDGAVICDVGTGYGATARLLAARFGARVTGLTVSSAQLAYAQSQSPGSDNPRYLLRDWMDNRLPAGQFDGCIAIESSEHMPDQGRFFAECARVLKPGGRLVICAWLARTNPSPKEVRFLLEPICREGRLTAMGDEEDYGRWLRESGFTLVGQRDLSRAVQRTWSLSASGMVRYGVHHPEALRFLFAGPDNRVFAKTVLRIWLAYATGAMRYVVFTAVK